MSFHLDPPLVPRNGQLLKVLAICRISTMHQDERSLDDQLQYYRRWLTENYDGDYKFDVVSSRDSGEYLDRVELVQIDQLVKSDEIDLVLTEDLARYCRRVQAVQFCELCQDHGVRVVAINDNVDTAKDGWKLISMFAAYRHESYNVDTGKRIRRSQRNRFTQGGVFQFEVYGYIKPAGAKCDADVQKDPAAEPFILGIFERLERQASYAEVADWLNVNLVKPGRYCRSAKWDRTQVSRLVRNPILKGVRVRNRKMAQRINMTGRRKAINAPKEELLERVCPHLAFVDSERFDRLQATLAVRNAHCRRKLNDGRDPRADIPKKRTRWPGQALTCGVCGRMCHFGGNGIPGNLCCSGIGNYVCWNTIGVNGKKAAEKLNRAIASELASLECFEPTLIGELRDRLRSLEATRDADLTHVGDQLAEVERKITIVISALEVAGHSAALLTRLAALETEQCALKVQVEHIKSRPRESLTLPTPAELKGLVGDALNGLSLESPEFGRLMAKLAPKIVTVPYRMIDGGAMVLRAEVELSLASLTSVHPEVAEDWQKVGRRRFMVDLFDPPQREAFRGAVMQLRKDGHSVKEAAKMLGITKTAAQRASSLQRLLDEMGITDPYCRMTGPPDDISKIKRHRHLRFRFKPRPGFPIHS